MAKSKIDSPFFFFNLARAAVRNRNLVKVCAAVFDARGKLIVNGDIIMMNGIVTNDPEHTLILPYGWGDEIRLSISPVPRKARK